MNDEQPAAQPQALQMAMKLAHSVYQQAAPTVTSDLQLAQVFATVAHTQQLAATTEALEAIAPRLEAFTAALERAATVMAKIPAQKPTPTQKKATAPRA